MPRVLDLITARWMQEILHRPLSGLWLAGNEGMEKNMEIAVMGYIGTTIRIHSFIPSWWMTLQEPLLKVCRWISWDTYRV